MRGYEGAAGEFGALTAADFAKWVAALTGWFSVTGARALGRFDDTDEAKFSCSDDGGGCSDVARAHARGRGQLGQVILRLNASRWISGRQIAG
jgi:hypothetical protein